MLLLGLRIDPKLNLLKNVSVLVMLTVFSVPKEINSIQALASGAAGAV